MSLLGAPFWVFQAVSAESRFCRCPALPASSPTPHGGWALRPEPGAPCKVPVVPRSALGDLLTTEGGGQGNGGPSPHACLGNQCGEASPLKAFPRVTAESC